MCCQQPSLVPRKAASALEGSQQGACSGARSPRAETLFFLTGFKTKPTRRASLLRERWRNGLDGAALTFASTSSVLSVGAEGTWGRAHPATRRDPRVDRWRKGVGTCRAMGDPKGKPGATGVTLHSASVTCGSRRPHKLGGSEKANRWHLQGKETVPESPPHLPRLAGPSRATSLTFPGWDPSDAVHSRRAGDWVYRSARKRPSGIRSQVRRTPLPPGPWNSGALAHPVTQAVFCPDCESVTQELEWKFSSL